MRRLQNLAAKHGNINGTVKKMSAGFSHIYQILASSEILTFIQRRAQEYFLSSEGGLGIAGN